jgi:Concanavalin A-like lectin/glucanases superfamily
MHTLRWLLFFVLVPWVAFAQQAQPLPTPDQSALLLRGLVSWWRGVPGFTGGSTMYDITPTRNNGVLTNMAFTSTSGWNLSTRAGGGGQVNFDGVDDFVTIGDVPTYDFPDATFSVEVSFQATAQGYLVARRTAASGGGGWFIRLDNPGALTARIVTPSNTQAGGNTSVTATLFSGAWTHAIVVFTTNTVTSSSNSTTIYLNGVLDQGTPLGAADVYTPCNGGANCPVVFGVISDQATGTWLTGAIDQVRIWNRGLSDGEIAALYAEWQRGDVSLAQLPRTVMPAQAAAGVAQKPRKFFNTFR